MVLYLLGISFCEELCDLVTLRQEFVVKIALCSSFSPPIFYGIGYFSYCSYSYLRHLNMWKCNLEYRLGFYWWRTCFLLKCWFVALSYPLPPCTSSTPLSHWQALPSEFVSVALAFCPWTWSTWLWTLGFGSTHHDPFFTVSLLR